MRCEQLIQGGEGLSVMQMLTQHDNGCEMTLSLKICVATCLSIGLLAATAAGGQSGSLKDQINDHEQKLADARQKKDMRSAATELNFV